MSRTSLLAACLLLLPSLSSAQAWRNPGRPAGAPGRLPRLAPPLTSGFPESVSRPPAADEDPSPEVKPRACESRPWDYMACRDSDRDLVDGFHFNNTGVNRVIPRPYDPLQMSPQRWFQVDYHSHARQDISLWVSDMPTGRVSDFLESYFMIFPRIVLPSIRVAGGRFIVTLANGEGMLFDEASKEMVGGVFSETTPQTPGVFPRLAYSGSGVVVRADKRGGDPRLRTTAEVRRGAQTCRVPSAELWTQSDEHVDFRFPTDEAFDAFLKTRCGFGLP